MTRSDVSIVIPTYERGHVLVETLGHVLEQPQGVEILVMDQTPRHEPEVASGLERLEASGLLRWFKLSEPSIPKAMNEGLRRASRPIVLFLDDDVIPVPDLVGLHAACYSDPEIWAVAGQVLQPGQQAESRHRHSRAAGLRVDLDFSFNHNARAKIDNCIACNFSVRRDRALSLGGFDENFVGVAYRFETEFCRRLRAGGGATLFEPAASVRHLKAPRGGIRTHGDHRTSASPTHGVGDYYFALRHGSRGEAFAYMIERPFREVCTRFHLKHPWWIPIKLAGELRAFLWALRLARAGHGLPASQ